MEGKQTQGRKMLGEAAWPSGSISAEALRIGLPWWLSGKRIHLQSRRPAAMLETLVRSLGQEDLLEKETATHSNILAWETPRTEEPGQRTPRSVGSQRIRYNLPTKAPPPPASWEVWISEFRFGLTNLGADTWHLKPGEYRRGPRQKKENRKSKSSY